MSSVALAEEFNPYAPPATDAGLRVIRVDGAPVDFWSGVVLREWVLRIVQLIPYLGALIGLIDVLLIFGDERQCLHDMIASTKVVQDLPAAYRSP